MHLISTTLDLTPHGTLKAYGPFFMLVSQEVYDRRIRLCRDCPRHLANDKCGACGCFMGIKARAAHSYCPIGTWKAERPEA